MAASPADVVLQLLAILALLYAAGLILGRLAERAKVPSVLGEITAGLLLGPSALAVFSPANPDYGFALEAIGQIGIVFLIFSVGLDTKIADLKRVGRAATETAVLGVVAPLAAGTALILALYADWHVALFVGAAMVATSVGITARVLADLKLSASIPARIIHGAAVIDDVLGMIVLAVVGALAGGRAASVFEIALIVGGALAFVIGALYMGPPLVAMLAGEPKPAREAPPKESRSAIVVAVALCFGLAAVSGLFRLAPIVGAFLAGVALADVQGRYEIRRQVEPLRALLAPFFFMVLGAKVTPGAVLTSPPLLALALALTAIAAVTKYYPCRLGARSLGKTGARAVGFAMIPRGEVGLTVAATGLGLGVLSGSLFSVIVFVSLGTSVIGPAMLRLALRPPTVAGHALKVARPVDGGPPAR